MRFPITYAQVAELKFAASARFLSGINVRDKGEIRRPANSFKFPAKGRVKFKAGLELRKRVDGNGGR